MLNAFRSRVCSPITINGISEVALLFRLVYGGIGCSIDDDIGTLTAETGAYLLFSGDIHVIPLSCDHLQSKRLTLQDNFRADLPLRPGN